MTHELYDQASSDPLPYTQVDRAVKQTAALIASRLRVPFQHALGGLVQFWELCGDPRDLQKLISAGKNEVVLERADVARRFANAMGVDASTLDPDDLVALRLLELRPDGYRVRGMSRYLKPLKRRVQLKDAAKAGGRASAKRRTERFGTAQPPRSGSGSSDASTDASGHASSVASAKSGRPAQTPEAKLEAPPNTAVSVQRASEEDVRAQAPAEPKKPARPHRKLSVHEAFFEWAQLEAARRAPGRAAEQAPKPQMLNAKLKPWNDQIGRSGLERAWRKYLDEPGARAKGWPWAFFVSQLPRHHNAAIAAPAAAEEDRCRPL